MFDPSELVGHHFLITAVTDCGPYQRLVKAFDEDDALEQVVGYLHSEGIRYEELTTRRF